MLADSLPQSTPYDPAEDPPSSIDPLGTVTSAEQLADVLLPGLTARMWRARHLTFSAFAALVAERAAAAEGGSEEMRLEARLGLERLFVSAVAWKGEKEEGWSNAARRLPGIGLARRAIRAGHQPLTVTKEAALPFLLTARAPGELAQNSGARAFFAEGLSSSYEAFHHTRTARGMARDMNDEGKPVEDADDDCKYGATTVPTSWYEQQVAQIIPSRDATRQDRLLHPKVTTDQLRRHRCRTSPRTGQ